MQPAAPSDDRVLWELVVGPVAMLAGPANVVMQLSWPEVGHGVVESKVDRGKVTLHPLKRFRTTFTYLAVAMAGSDDERRAFRRAVDRSHVAVRSGPDSPVAYNAFDRGLQLWVAACLWQGTLDVVRVVHGPPDDTTADALYAAARRFATGLQVPARDWPADRAAFDAYWKTGLDRIDADPVVGGYLDDLVHLRFLPAPLRMTAGPFTAWVTRGFLPPEFRDALGWAWSATDARRFARFLRVTGTAARHLPGTLRHFPFNWCLWDLRRRMRGSLPLT